MPLRLSQPLITRLAVVPPCGTGGSNLLCRPRGIQHTQQSAAGQGATIFDNTKIQWTEKHAGEEANPMLPPKPLLGAPLCLPQTGSKRHLPALARSALGRSSRSKLQRAAAVCE